MRVFAGALAAVLALAGCAQRSTPPTVAPGVERTVVAVDVTNDLGREIDVYLGMQYLGRLAPNAHQRYAIPPTTAGRIPLYARFTRGVGSERTMNIANGRTARYVFDPPVP
ncbi:MAG TPA: hypothetical protein VM890_10895 [Longimicrobium sp.]|nr:hypothetical protein [Longimicrobium sp.]